MESRKNRTSGPQCNNYTIVHRIRWTIVSRRIHPSRFVPRFGLSAVNHSMTYFERIASPSSYKGSVEYTVSDTCSLFQRQWRIAASAALLRQPSHMQHHRWHLCFANRFCGSSCITVLLVHLSSPRRNLIDPMRKNAWNVCQSCVSRTYSHPVGIMAFDLLHTLLVIPKMVDTSGFEPIINLAEVACYHYINDPLKWHELLESNKLLRFWRPRHNPHIPSS